MTKTRNLPKTVKKMIDLPLGYCHHKGAVCNLSGVHKGITYCLWDKEYGAVEDVKCFLGEG